MRFTVSIGKETYTIVLINNSLNKLLAMTILKLYIYKEYIYINEKSLRSKD